MLFANVIERPAASQTRTATHKQQRPERTQQAAIAGRLRSPRRKRTPQVG
jgi:hypothetical protein